MSLIVVTQASQYDPPPVVLPPVLETLGLDALIEVLEGLILEFDDHLKDGGQVYHVHSLGGAGQELFQPLDPAEEREVSPLHFLAFNWQFQSVLARSFDTGCGVTGQRQEFGK